MASSTVSATDARERGAGPVLVAGGTGFIGAAIVRALHDRGRPVSVLSRRPERVRARFPSLAVDGRGGDVRRPETLAPALAGIDTVVHCVQFAGFPVEDPARGRTFMEVDAGGTRSMARAARAGSVRELVYLSAVGADRSSPRSWYRAKGLAEAAVSESGLSHVIVRPSWVYGPEDDSLNRFLRILRMVPGFFPQIGPGTQRIDPVFIEDVARLVVRALEEDLDGVTIEIGGPQTLTLDEVIREAMRVVGREKPIVHFPVPLVKAAAFVLELLPGQLLSRGAVDFVTQSAVADDRELRRRFPEFERRPLGEALEDYAGR